MSIGHTKDNIVVYNAYGNNHQVIVQGRMEKKKDFKKVTQDDGWFRNLWRRLRQVEGDEIESENIDKHIGRINIMNKVAQ